MVTSEIEKVNDVRFQLSITVPTADVNAAIDAAITQYASQANMPGFRKGKVPKKLIVSRVGIDAIKDQAIQNSLGSWVNSALREHKIIPVGRPNVEVKEFDQDKDAVLTVDVDIKPEIDLPNYKGVEIEGPEWEVTDEDVENALKDMRMRFAEIQEIDRPIEEGDLLTITITGTLDGEKVEDASAEDMPYEVPKKGSTDSVLDKKILGAKAGDTLKFVDNLGKEFGDLEGKDVDFVAEIKDARVRVLPELDDDFALTASEFDTFKELEADLRERIGEQKVHAAHANKRAYIIADLTEKLEFTIPESLIDEEYNFQINRLSAQSEQSGLEFAEFLELATGGNVEELLNRIRQEATATVKARLVVEAVADKEDVQIEDGEIEGEIARQAAMIGRDPQEVANTMLNQSNIGVLVNDIRRRKAIDILVAGATITNEPPALPTADTISELVESGEDVVVAIDDEDAAEEAAE